MSLPGPQFESINSSALSLLYDPALISIHNYWKNHSFWLYGPLLARWCRYLNLYTSISICVHICIQIYTHKLYVYMPIIHLYIMYMIHRYVFSSFKWDLPQKFLPAQKFCKLLLHSFPFFVFPSSEEGVTHNINISITVLLLQLVANLTSLPKTNIKLQFWSI